VNVWDVETGDVVTEIKASENAVHPVRFSPDGLVLAAGSYASYPYTGEVTLWSPTSGERLGKVQNDSGDMGQSFGFSLDGRVLALGAKDRRVHLFDVESGRRKHTITATKYVANSIAFAPPGLMLIAGVVPRQEHDSRVIPGIEIWDSTTFKPIRTLEAMEGFYIVGGLAVSPDGSMLAAGLSGNGGRVLLWDMKTFARTTLAGYNGAIDAVGFSPDGKYLAAGCQDKHVRVWDLARSEFKGQLQPLEEAVRSVAFAPGGRFFAAGSAGGGTSTLWVWPSDTVVNLRATEIKDRAGAVLATVEGKGLDGADLHGKTLDGAVLTGTRAIPATSGVVSRQDRAKPRESGLKRLLRSLFRR
jgi:WD40 repeat protein